MYVIPASQPTFNPDHTIQNKDSLDQLPYLGKKSVPPRLRKDLWSPFAMVYFPSPNAGLAAYRKLREFRRLHETCCNIEDITEKEGKYAGSLYPTKKRGKVIMNQKANSVADLAAVLWQQEKGPSDERKANAGRRIEIVGKLKQQKGQKKVKKNPLDVDELGGTGGVYVRWADILDAEYAETWPGEVVHDVLLKSRHTAAWPALEVEKTEKEQEPVVTQEQGQPQEKEQPKPGWRDSILSWIPGRSQSPVATPA